MQQVTEDWQEILIERYQVEKVLGKKAGRRTLLAKDLNNNELVVIKILIFNHDFLWDDLKLFEREAETLETLDHPYIPRYLDYFEINLPNAKGFALVQNYIDAPSLEEKITAGRTFSQEEIKQLAQALLEILIYLHGRNPAVIHRDIKPSNILLKNSSGNSVGEVYLVDFGSVQTVASQEGNTFTVVGTYGYMAPEQFSGKSIPASDIYSLGATLIYLLTGKQPSELQQENLQIKLESLNNTLEASLIDWLEWMTEPLVSNRLKNAREALDFLQEGGVRKGKFAIRKQPKGSKVICQKRDDYLAISIPSVFKVGQFFLTTISTIVFLRVTYLLFTSLFSLGLPWWDILVVLFFLACIIGFDFLLVIAFFFDLFSLFSSKTIRITTKAYPLRHKTTRNYLELAKQDIVKLEYIPPTITFNSDGYYNNPAQLCLWQGVTQYKLQEFFGSNLTAPELEWLEYELSNWLSLPVNKVEKKSPENKLISSENKQDNPAENTVNFGKKTYASNIVINKGKNTLEITIPAAKKNNKNGDRLEIDPMTGLILFLVIIWMLGQAIAVLISVLANPLVLSALLTILIIYKLNSHTYFQDETGLFIYIDREKFSYYLTCLGQKKILKESSRQDIVKLELKPKTSQKNKELIIWAGIEPYIIKSSDRISEKELDWLAQELSDFLRLPLDRD